MEPSEFIRGVSSLVQLRNGNGFVVDKSTFFPLLLKFSMHVTLLYPPRFGKSFTLSSAAVWFDHKTSTELFHKCFPTSALGAHQAQTFFVLRLDLSVDTSGGSADDIRKRLFRKIIGSLSLFCSRYGLTVKDESYGKDAFEYLRAVAAAVRFSSHKKMLVLIDEYDRFFNKVLLEGSGCHLEPVALAELSRMVEPLCSLFETLKDISNDDDWEAFRTITAGVSPLAIAESSGWNCASILTPLKEFAGLMGFTESDIIAGLHLIEHIDADSHVHFLSLFRRFFNGYRFHPDAATVYNPTLCISFLWRLKSEPDLCKRLLKHAENDDLALLGVIDDPNVNTSSSVLSLLGAAGGGASLAVWDVFHAKTEDGMAVPLADLHQPVRLGEIVMSDRHKTTVHAVRVKSLVMLVHHGVLTLRAGLQPDGTVLLVIPNLIVRLRRVNALMASMNPAGNHIFREALIDPSADGLQAVFNGFLRDPAYGSRVVLHQNFSEATFQMTMARTLELLLRFLPVQGILLETEGCLPREHQTPGFADIVMRDSSGRHQIVLELKCVRVSALDYEDVALQEKAAHARFHQGDLWDYFDGLTVDRLRALRIRSAHQRYYRQACSVEDVINQGIAQAREYAQGVRAVLPAGGGVKPDIHAFVVALVGTRVVVQEAIG